MKFAAALGLGVASISAASFAQNVPLPLEQFSNPPPPSAAALESENRLKLAIANNPKSAAIWTDFGWQLYKDGRYGEALWVMGEARKLAPTDAYVLWLSGLASYAMGQYAGAKQQLWQMWEQQKTWPETVDMGVTYDLLGRLFLDEGKLFEAAYFLSKSAELQPNNWQVQFILGITEWFRERYGSSLEALAKVRALRPTDPLILRCYAAAKLAVDEREVLDTQKAAQLDMYPQAAQDAQKAQLEFQADVNVIRKAVAAAPQDPETLELLGRYYVARGDTPNALAALRQAVGLKGSTASARYILAKTLLSLGTPQARDESKQLLVDAIAQSPGYWEGSADSPHAGLLITLLLQEGNVTQARALMDWVEAQQMGQR
jgi:Flp pilus assembly protein TadD